MREQYLTDLCIFKILLKYFTILTSTLNCDGVGSRNKKWGALEVLAGCVVYCCS